MTIMGTGNHMIDEDMGSDPRSPLYDGPMIIDAEIKVFLWNEETNKWDYDVTHPIDETAVTVENLKEWIRDQVPGDHIKFPLTVIKNHCDEVIIEEDTGDNEKVKYLMQYE